MPAARNFPVRVAYWLPTGGMLRYSTDPICRILMLTALHIRDFAIIEEVSLALEPGLTVLTGETGAGKSILVDALEQVLGGRGDAALIRHGAGRAEINASFDLEHREEARAWLVEQALDEEGGECHMRRVIQSDGRSRGFINGRPVPVQSLRELGQCLVEIHGQHEHQSLLHRSHQIDLLDDYGDCRAALERVADAYHRHREIQSRLDGLPGAGEERDRQLEYLRHQVSELEDLGITSDEIATLESEQRRLAHARELMDVCSQAVDRLDGDSDLSVGQLLGRTRQDLESLLTLDDRLREPLELIESALIQMREGVDAIQHYLSDLDLDPERLAGVEERLGAAHDLARKHRVSMEELPATLDELRRQLDDLEGAEGRRAELEAELGQARAEYDELARSLATLRRDAADRLGKAVTKLMASLGMKGGRLEFDITSDAERLSAAGTESVEMLVTANPGQPLRALRRVASGGELSRIALAVQVATVDLGSARTLIFDEVDAGVGGAVAEIVGRELRRIGAVGQALCVTHLPQVAAQGHRHFNVSKAADRRTTRTNVTRLEEKARTEEIARMLGGVKVTETTTAHAREMLEQARGAGLEARGSGG